MCSQNLIQWVATVLPRREGDRPTHEAHQTAPFNAEHKNVYSYAYTSPAGYTTVPLPFNCCRISRYGEQFNSGHRNVLLERTFEF